MKNSERPCVTCTRCSESMHSTLLRKCVTLKRNPANDEVVSYAFSEMRPTLLLLLLALSSTAVHGGPIAVVGRVVAGIGSRVVSSIGSRVASSVGSRVGSSVAANVGRETAATVGGAGARTVASDAATTTAGRIGTAESSAISGGLATNSRIGVEISNIVNMIQRSGSALRSVTSAAVRRLPKVRTMRTKATTRKRRRQKKKRSKKEDYNDYNSSLFNDYNSNDYNNDYVAPGNDLYYYYSDADSSPDTACEGTSLDFLCPSGMIIASIQDAFYGE